MANKIAIASASSAEYFHFIQGMVLSVRDKPQSKDIDICLYDLGLTDEQKTWLGGYVSQIVAPKWEYGLTETDGMRDPFRAILAKPLIPRYFPGYDIYLHLDADAWVQEWWAIEAYLKAAETAALAITPEIHRAYTANYTASHEFREFIVELYRGTWGEDYVKKYSYYPILNAGVFAMPKDSPIWELWRKNIEVSLQKSHHHCIEQAALNLAVFEHPDQFHFAEPDRKNIQFLPATCNWLCHQSMPLLDRSKDRLVEPYLPYSPIGVIHRSSDDFKDKKAGTVYTTDGDSALMNLKYREGSYETTVQSVEPEQLSDWQGRGGKKF
ncbi:MAG: hypothetical protein JOY64_21730 [Alphaproteobacteria bacterium]|nr:hypothetical protein [Alphaproteobacteria bacterium]MBV8410264.1 hypothetical protein [Alphaproteobacteria bacterium]